MARQLKFPLDALNFEALNESLREVFGDDYIGMNTDGESIHVHIAETISSSGEAAVRQIVEQHDSKSLSKRQQITAERSQKLSDTLLHSEMDSLNPDSFPEPFRLLAQKIVWLEQELLALRSNKLS